MNISLILLFLLIVTTNIKSYSQRISGVKWKIFSITDSSGTEIIIPERYCFVIELPRSSNKKKLNGLVRIEDCNKEDQESIYNIKTVNLKLNYLNHEIYLSWEGYPINGKEETILRVLDEKLFIHFMNIFISHGTFKIVEEKLVFELYTRRTKYKGKYYKVNFRKND